MKRIIVQIDNRIRDTRQAVGQAKKKRDQEIFDSPAAGGTVGLPGTGPGGGGSGFIADGSGGGTWAANGGPACIPYPHAQTILDEDTGTYSLAGEGTIGEIFFDGLLADDNMYDLTDGIVTPTEALLPNTIVTAQLRPE